MGAAWQGVFTYIAPFPLTNAMGIAPRKQLSQNFLTDQRVAQRIVDSLGIEDTDSVLEIGPGTGALTQWIARTPAKRIVAVDLDPRAIDHCKAQPWSAGRVEYLHADIRTVSPAELFPGERCLVLGNLPYGISSDLLFWILGNHASIRSAVIMVQREVARRLVASPGTKDYGILSVAVWQGAKADLLFHVQPGSFFPKPSVVSSVVKLDLYEKTRVPDQSADFQDFVRGAFSQRRKVLSNSLKSWASRHSNPLVDKVVALDKTRAEQLSPEQLAELFQRLTT